jgi:arylsulfatase A-like enzyme
MRADRMGVLGYPRPVTPHLDRLARGGVLFEQAIANAPWTLPSHVSIFTSILPFDHGVRHAGQSVPRGLSLLSEHFRESGYRTGAFTGGGYVSYGYRFDQGFEIYRDHNEREEGGPNRIAEEALRWVRSLDGEPFFLFVHTYEPHFPYTNSDFADPADAGRLHVNYDPDEMGIESLTEAERRYAVGLYDSDVANADRVIGGMLEALEGEGILDGAILVVLSDHGEDCWDHDARAMPRHGHTLYEELLRVPLFIRSPGAGITPGTRITTPVSLMDVAPTILDLAGLPPAREHRGRSLATLCLSGEEPSVLPIHAESTRYGPERFSLRNGRYKAIVTPFPERVPDGKAGVRTPPPVEMFDLASDPYERTPQIREEGPAASLVPRLRERAASLPGREAGLPSEQVEPSEELLEQLRSLGYVDEKRER